MTRKIKISVLVVLMGVVAFPVESYFQAYGFFNPSNKYREWFHNTVWLQDTRVREAARGGPRSAARNSIAVKYPYPDKPFVMTEKRWLKAANEAIHGKPDWYDVEVVRQRAEVEEYAPAMDLLGWMYQEGRGIQQDLRKAYTMYERAKLAGKPKVSRNTAKIFNRLTQPEQRVAEIQLLEDIKRIKPDVVPAKKVRGPVNLYVLEQQRGLKSPPVKRKNAPRRRLGLLDFID
ncbi:MAG: hypothetical protein V3U48_03615 [Rhodospirillales bacterium]